MTTTQNTLNQADQELIERIIYKSADDIAVAIAISFERLEERIDAVETRIEQLFVATPDGRDAFTTALRALILNRACTPSIRPPAPPRRRDADLPSLLHRMHSLRSE